MTGRTLIDKIWDEHVIGEVDDGLDLLHVDRHLVHEMTSPKAFDTLSEHWRRAKGVCPHPTATSWAVRVRGYGLTWPGRPQRRCLRSKGRSQTSGTSRAMDAFTVTRGPAAPLMLADVNTDIISPVHAGKGDLGQDAFGPLRYLSDGSKNPAFVLNRERFRGAPILLTAQNFGCGSSREHAVWWCMTSRDSAGHKAMDGSPSRTKEEPTWAICSPARM